MIECIKVYKVIEENCYCYIDDKTKHGFLIDPGANASSILEVIHENNWVIEKILLTHGHFDHIEAVKALNIPYYIYESEINYLTNEDYNLSRMFGYPMTLNNAHFIHDGDILKVDSLQLQVIYTPGHTLDSVCFYSENDHILFSGDTLFKDSIGATHFPGGSYPQLLSSIKEKLLKLPDETIVYSGHTSLTTIKNEKLHF